MRVSDIDESGYWDRLYVHKDYQSQGIATRLTDKLEKYVFNKEIFTIITHATITARPFFEKQGYTVVKEELVECRGVLMSNFITKKVLTP